MLPSEDRGRGSRLNALRADGIPAGIWWRAAAVLAIGLVLALGLLGALLLLAFPLALLLAAIVLAAALEPAVGWLEGRLPRKVASALVYLLVLVLTVAIVWFIATRLLTEAQEVLANAPALIDQFQTRLASWNPTVARALDQTLQAWVQNAANLLVGLPVLLVESILSAILVLVMSVYWSVASPELRRFSFSFVPPHLRDEASAVAWELVNTSGGYIRARIIVGLVVAAVTYVGAQVLQLDFALMLALLAGVAELVPFAGPLAAAAPAVAIGLLDSPRQALVVAIFYTVVQQLKSHLLVPNVARQQANIPPLLTIFAVLAGGWIGGVVGALVGPPVAGVLRILLLRVAAPALQRWAGTGGRSDDPEQRDYAEPPVRTGGSPDCA